MLDGCVSDRKVTERLIFQRLFLGKQLRLVRLERWRSVSVGTDLICIVKI